MRVSEMYGELGGDLRQLMAQRLASASVQEVLVEDRDKTLALMQEPDGRQFVRRDYTEEGVYDLEHPMFGMALPISHGLEVMQTTYAAVGIKVAETSVKPAESGDVSGGVTLLTEYVPNTVSLKSAPLEVKKEAVASLARLLDPAVLYLPGPEAMVSDLFVVAQDDQWEYYPIVVDVDPRVTSKADRRVDHVERFLTQLTLLIEVNWANGDDEESALALSALKEISEFDNDTLFDAPERLDTLMRLHSFTQPSFMRF